MQNKDEILNSIKIASQNNTLTQEEIVNAYNSSILNKTSNNNSFINKKVSYSEILYFLGGIVVSLGITILIYQNWYSLNWLTRVIFTIGFSVISFILGYFLTKKNKTKTLGLTFYFLSALIAPIALMVFLYLLGIQDNTIEYRILISSLILATYITSYLFSKKDMFLMFSIIGGTWLYFNLTNFFYLNNLQTFNSTFYIYIYLLLGLIYTILGYIFSKTITIKSSSELLYNLGCVIILSATFILSGKHSDLSIFWEIIYPFIIAVYVFLSIYIEKISFLSWSTLFLMIFIFKITSEYFSKGMGWPLTLIISGFLMISIGYMSITIRKKFLNK